jgi:hypothetical protein
VIFPSAVEEGRGIVDPRAAPVERHAVTVLAVIRRARVSHPSAERGDARDRGADLGGHLRGLVFSERAPVNDGDVVLNLALAQVAVGDGDFSDLEVVPEGGTPTDEGECCDGQSAHAHGSSKGPSGPAATLKNESVSSTRSGSLVSRFLCRWC